jgi:rhodanese-related sulfurtransferase
MKGIFVLLCMVLIGLSAACVQAGEYRYVGQETFRSWLNENRSMKIVDIQTADAYARKHFKGAMETNAYPVKSEDDRGKLKVTVAGLRASSDDVVIVCPRGGGGAKATFDYLIAQGVAEKRLYILEKGMDGWPYGEMTIGK